MHKTISFKFSGFSGDVIHYLAGIKKVCEDQGATAEIYIWLDREGRLYEGANHPYDGKMINQYAFDMMKPLLRWQRYVSKVEAFSGQQIMVDMDKIREVQLDMPYGNLSHWLGMKFPDMQSDLSKPWIEVPKFISQSVDGLILKAPEAYRGIEESILINRTSRYLNPFISYFFLEKYKDHLVFVGLEKEYWEFRNQWGLDNLRALVVQNFLELAMVIQHCKFFIGNQSMCFAIAEALKVPRLLEMCPYAPNVHPVGSSAHYFKFQEGLTYWVDRLDKTV